MSKNGAKMKIWRISVSQARLNIFSAIMYLKLEVEFLDHIFILFRMAHSDFKKTAPILRFIGLNTKMSFFSTSIFVVFIVLLKYSSEDSSKF